MYRTAQLFLQRYTRDDVNLAKVCILFRTLAITLGGLHVIAAISSQSMNADGISYLDIGDAYFRADWQNAINPVWSPLYSWILGLANVILRPSMEWEFPVVHIVNFFIYLFALASFEFMWARVRKTDSDPQFHHIPKPLWWTLGYVLFIWASLCLIQIWSVTPDMLMAGLVFLAAGLIAQIRAGNDNYRLFLGLGMILGLGYLSKTFVFSIAPIFLCLVCLVQRRTWSAFRKTLLAASMFLLVCLPFILMISKVKGEFTIGEAGTVTYVRHVVGIPSPHWQGDPLLGIIPTHRSRVVHKSPPVYEFGEPIGGTYPISTDPSYWYEGIDVPVRWVNLLRSLSTSAFFYLDLFFQRQGVLLACVLALYFMNWRMQLGISDILKRWTFVIPAIIAFGLYGLVLVANRYLGAWILLFWADTLANIRLPKTRESKSWLNALIGIAALGLLVNIILFNLDGFTRLNSSLQVAHRESATAPARPLAVAETLLELGVEPGDKVGVIGYAYDSFWARLARVRIVAEMLDVDSDDFWRGDEALRQSVLQTFAGTGAIVVVAEHVPGHVQLDDWYQVGESNYYVFLFDR